MNFSEYDIVEEISSTAQFSLVRIRDRNSCRQYILKQFYTVNPDQEINEIDDNDLPLLLYSGDSTQNGRGSVVYQDVRGCSLSRYLQLNAPLPQDDFLKMASGLISMLSFFHGKGWMIRNLRPEGVLYNNDSGQCLLTDTHKATRIIKQQLLVSGNEEIESLYYISPEQSGRISCATDFRADYYSLGVIFYKALTARLPYAETERLSLMHSIVGRLPKAPSTINPNIAEGLNCIVMRLLEKDPEARYQSLNVLKNDLFPGSYEQVEEPLGNRDVPLRLSVTDKLTGRKDILEKLDKALAQIRQGNKQVVYLKGNSGVGKTRIVTEFFRVSQKENIRYISAKFDLLQRDIPFTALNVAIKELMRQLLSEEESVLNFWKNRLLNFLQGNGQLLITDIPELSLIIGPQPPVQELPPQEAQNRYNQTCIHLMEAFTTDEQWLAVFIDDLQWADIASIKLIELINITGTIRNLLFIGAYRTEEVDKTHPLAVSMQKQEQWIFCKEIEVPPLTLEDMTDLIRSLLPGTIKKEDELTALLFMKTQGNPYFIIQLISSFFETKKIVRNSTSGWEWDEQALMAAVPGGTIAGILGERLQRLEHPMLEVIKTAACLGDIFDFKTLMHIRKSGAEPVAEMLSRAVNEGFIIALDENLNQILLRKVAKPTLNARFKFIHDAVRQAAIAFLTSEEISRANLTAAKYKLANFSSSELHDDIFYLASNFNLGASHLQRTDYGQCREVNLQAGLRAKNASAFEAAILYFESGKQYGNFRDNYSTMYRFYLEAAICKFLTGKYSEAEQDLDFLLGQSATKLDKLNVLFQKSHLYTIQEKKKLGIDVARQGYALFGRQLPSGKMNIMARLLYNLIKARLIFGGKDLESLIDQKLISDKEQERFLEFLLEVASPIYQYDQKLFAWNTLQMLMLTHKYGNNGIASFGYLGFGMIISQLFGKYEKGQQFAQLAINLNNRLHYTSLKWKIQLSYYNFVHHWTRPIKPELDRILEIENGAFANGDPLFAGYAIFIYHQKKFALGFALDTLQESFEEYLKQVFQRQDLETRHFLESYYYAIRALRGLDDNNRVPGKLFNTTERIDDLKKLSSYSVVACMYIACCITYYHFGEYDRALTHYEEGLNYIDFVQQRYEFAEFNFFGVLICAKAIDDKLVSQGWGLKKIHTHLKKLSRWKNLCPENFEPQYLIAFAEYKRISGKSNQAIQYMEKGISKAQEYQFVQYKGLACELAGRQSYREGNTMMAETYIKNACEAYQQWGASALVEKLQQEFGMVAAATSTIGRQNKAAGNNAIPSLDLGALLNSAQQIGQEAGFDELVAHYLKIIVQYSGADKVFLLINVREELLLKGVYESRMAHRVNDYPDGTQVPLNLIRYVMRIKAPVRYTHPARSPDLGAMIYYSRHKPHAVCCLPVMSQGRVFGILYLENYLNEGAFNEQDMPATELIASHMAMALDNATLMDSIEIKIRARTEEIESRMDISENLLRNVLPGEAIEELKNTGKSIARRYNDVSILMADIKGFTLIAEKLSPEELINLIDHHFRAFDAIMEKRGMDKIKTIGDAYMAAGGLSSSARDGAAAAIAAAIDMQQFMAAGQPALPDGMKLELRIGIHTGTVIAGVVGSHRFQYDIWGDPVNVAARMEQCSEPGRINISEATRQLAGDAFTYEYRGKIDAKNKSNLAMYFIAV